VKIPLWRTGFHRGDLVRVRPFDEIQATLDSTSRLEGLPWMQEMAKFCGGQFRVFRRAEKVFLDHHFYVGGLRRTVLLENAHCDGTSHGGCDMGCLLFWNDAWLDRAEVAKGGTGEEAMAAHAQARGDQSAPSAHAGGRFRCQATELAAVTRPLRWWSPGQYLREILHRDAKVRDILREWMLLGRSKVRRALGRKSLGCLTGTNASTATSALGLQPGELVEVKGREEIIATLDARGKNRGLSFTAEMARHCGQRFRVARRVQRIIVEWTGDLRPLANTVVLEGATCDGVAYRRCPRNCDQLWREIWLKRVETPRDARLSPDPSRPLARKARQ